MLIETINAGELYSTDLPADILAEDCGALICRGESMWPRLQAGDVAIYRRGARSAAELLGEEAVVGLPDGRVMMARIEPGSTPDVWTLKGDNRADMRDRPVLWALEVLAIIPGGSRGDNSAINCQGC